MLCVSLCGFLDSGKCKRVSTGELIRAPGNVPHSRFPWSLTAPVLLCHCSHPVAAITDKLHRVLCGIGPALVWQRWEEGRFHCSGCCVDRAAKQNSFNGKMLGHVANLRSPSENYDRVLMPPS